MIKENHNYIIFRRPIGYKWLRPYNEFIAGNWSIWIKIVNSKKRKKHV